MDELKQSVQLAVHEQKDPLLIYKFEAFELFKSLIDSVNKEILSFLFKAEISTDNNRDVKEASSRKPLSVNTSKDEIPNTEELRQRNRAITNRQSNQPVETIVRSKPKVGRNDKVTIKNIKNGQTKQVKYKHAEKMIAQGEWLITEHN